MAGPVTDAERKKVLALHAQGRTRNDIARKVKRSQSTITGIVHKAGLSFARSAETVAATEAKRLDARARRAAIAEKLLDDAERLRASLWLPAKIYNFGGRDNTYEQRDVDEPPFRDKRDIMQTVATALNTAVKLDEYDSGTGLPAAMSLLERIADGLTGKHGNGDNDFPDKAPPDA